jgi:MOSC domain-containing protein YiiM
MAGEIVSIWIKRAHRGVMDAVSAAELVTGRGIAGNADQRGRRHVTVLDEAAWREATREVGVDVDPVKRRANVLLRGIELTKSHGRMLLLGQCVIRIYGETRPCERMDEAQAGLRRALDPGWRAGAFGEIVQGGTINVGDEVRWLAETANLFDAVTIAR